MTMQEQFSLKWLAIENLNERLTALEKDPKPKKSPSRQRRITP